MYLKGPGVLSLGGVLRPSFSTALGGQGTPSEVVSEVQNKEFNFCNILTQNTLNSQFQLFMSLRSMCVCVCTHTHVCT